MSESILPAGLEHLAIQTQEKKASNNALDQSEFLNLILKQIENQDPLNPMESAEFTSQLAQIATVNGIEKSAGNIQLVRVDNAIKSGITSFDTSWSSSDG